MIHVTTIVPLPHNVPEHFISDEALDDPEEHQALTHVYGSQYQQGQQALARAHNTCVTGEPPQSNKPQRQQLSASTKRPDTVSACRSNRLGTTQSQRHPHGCVKNAPYNPAWLPVVVVVLLAAAQPAGRQSYRASHYGCPGCFATSRGLRRTPTPGVPGTTPPRAPPPPATDPVAPLAAAPETAATLPPGCSC